MPSFTAFYEKIKAPKSALADTFIITGLVLALNLTFALDDPGWTKLNPSPWILVPVLIGCRYGFLASFYAATSTLILLVGLNALIGFGLGARGFLFEQTYLVFSLYIFGGLAGEVQEFFRRKAQRLGVLHDEAKARLIKLDGDIKRIAQINDRLQRQVLVSGNQTYSLDIEIRGLYECQPEDMPFRLLQIFNRMERVTGAAVYQFRKGKELRRTAVVGKDTPFPAVMRNGDSALLDTCLEEKELMAVPEVLGERSPREEPWLFTVPLLDSKREVMAIVAVAEMPFMSFAPKNLRRINLIGEWAAEIFDLRLNADTGTYRLAQGRENKKIFTSAFFRKNLRLAWETAREHDVPSTIILAYSSEKQAPDRTSFENAVLKRVRSGDYAAEIETERPHLCVLLPFTGERGGTIFSENLRGMLEKVHPDFPPTELAVFDVQKSETPDDLWKELHSKVR